MSKARIQPSAEVLAYENRVRSAGVDLMVAYMIERPGNDDAMNALAERIARAHRVPTNDVASFLFRKLSKAIG